MSITSIVPELRALIHRVGARKDVTVVRKVIAGGLAAKGVADVARRKLPPELVELSSRLDELQWEWAFTGPGDGAVVGGCVDIPSLLEQRWLKPDLARPFAKGSRHLLLDRHAVDAGGYALARRGAAPSYVFARADGAGDPIVVAERFEAYLRAGMATGFARYWPDGSAEARETARRLATPCPLRSTVRATVRGVRARPRRDARVDAMRANLPGDHPRVLARLLGCALPRRATDDAVLALVGAALDALVADSDEALRARFAGGAWATVNVFDRGVGDDPPPARLRRALDVMTLGRAQPEALVELALTIEPLVPLPKFVDVSRHGMVVQVLAGREGSDLPTRLGDVALWDTSVVGDTALEHRAIVAAVLSPGAYNADALFREQRGEVSVLVDASVAVGMKVGDSWRAPVVLQ